MSTKLNAEELAAKRYQDHTEPDAVIGVTPWQFTRLAYAAAIREIAQPIADERDELREALEDVLEGWETMISAYGYDPAQEPEGSINQRARAVLAKYPKP